MGRRKMQVFRTTWKMITGLEWKSNWYKRSMLLVSFIIAGAEFFVSNAAEGESNDKPLKDFLWDIVFILIGASFVCSAVTNLMDPKDDEAPLLPVFRRPKDVTVGSFQAYQRVIDERDQQISKLQFNLASVGQASIDLERNVGDLVFDNRFLRSWANC